MYTVFLLYKIYYKTFMKTAQIYKMMRYNWLMRTCGYAYLRKKTNNLKMCASYKVFIVCLRAKSIVRSLTF